MFTLTPYVRRHRDVPYYDPFREFENLERAFFGGNAVSDIRTDIKDNGNAFVLEADLPGMKKEDIAIDIDGDMLSISAKRHSEYEEKDKQGNFLRCERSYGSYSRSFDISGIKKDDIKASYEDGVLKVELPKEEEKPVPGARRLAIE